MTGSDSDRLFGRPEVPNNQPSTPNRLRFPLPRCFMSANELWSRCPPVCSKPGLGFGQRKCPVNDGWSGGRQRAEPGRHGKRRRQSDGPRWMPRRSCQIQNGAAWTTASTPSGTDSKSATAVVVAEAARASAERVGRDANVRRGPRRSAAFGVATDARGSRGWRWRSEESSPKIRSQAICSSSSAGGR